MAKEIRKLEDYTAKQVIETVAQIMFHGGIPRMTIVRNDGKEDSFDILFNSKK